MARDEDWGSLLALSAAKAACSAADAVHAIDDEERRRRIADPEEGSGSLLAPSRSGADAVRAIRKQEEEAEEEEDWRALPAQLQQLLLDLARNALSELPILSEERFGCYFQGVITGEEGRYWRVRMRVLTAIANCRSLVTITPDIYSQIGKHRTEEMLVLLRGLASNPVLQNLDVTWCEAFGRQAACEALGQLVASSRSLRKLELRQAGLEARGLGALAEGFNKDSVLEELDLSQNHVGDAEGAQHLALILTTAPQLRRLDLEWINMDVAGAEVIANALPRCATLRFLAITTTHGWRRVLLHPGPVSTVLKRALTQGQGHENGPGSVPAAGITHLHLEIEEQGEAGLEDALAGMLRTNACIQRLDTTSFALLHGLDALRHNSTIHHLRFLRGDCDERVWMRLIPLLNQCKALRVLHLQDFLSGALASFKKALLRSLEDNASLTELDITGWHHLDDDLFADLMLCLQVNRTLRKVNITRTKWELEGKGAIIDRALARNATQQAYLPLLLDRQVPVMPKAGRLFLCGAPFAGKTTLRKTMVRACKGQTASSPGPSFQHPGTDTRTEGIEIEVLRNDDDMQITIWDLAGQAQYRALQDHLFPTYNQACVFLFAFSPFDSQHPHGLHSPEVLQDKFRTSLGFWLRFINSNCRSVGSTLPQVFVVVTHVDQLDTGDAGILPDLLQPVLNGLATECEKVIHVTTTPPSYIDARSANNVEPLLDALLESFRVLFATKLFWVPKVCNRLNAVLTAWVSQHPAQPIIKKQQFQALFADELQIFFSRRLQDDDDGDAMNEGAQFGAILAYLHDVGSIICFKDLGVVVVNPHWISHTFLGGVIKLLTESCRLSFCHGPLMDLLLKIFFTQPWMRSSKARKRTGLTGKIWYH